MGIPKIIHYCWFGNGEKSQQVKEYIDSWKKKLPDYKFLEWNENNFIISQSCVYVQEAYKKGKWAFVSDYVRLQVLYEYGGIYLDTDVEVIKPFGKLHENKVFMCSESRYSICTAVIGAEKGSAFIKKILQIYEQKKFILEDGRIDMIPNSQLLFKYLSVNYGYSQSDKIVHYNECSIYTADYFSPINCYNLKEKITRDTYCVHRFAGTWKNTGEKRIERIKAFITRIIGEENRNKIKKLVKSFEI